MADFGLSDVLTLVQTLAIIAALLVTLYFSRRQIQAATRDLEARVLNDLNEQLHRVGEIFIEKPEMIRVISVDPGAAGAQLPVMYYILFFFAHIFHMRQRGILQDNEWEGWHHWMKNAFQHGNIGTSWKNLEMGGWFDPAFRTFVDRDLLGGSPPAA